MIDRHELVVTELTDAELHFIASGGRTEDELLMKLFHQRRRRTEHRAVGRPSGKGKFAGMHADQIDLHADQMWRAEDGRSAAVVARAERVETWRAGGESSA